MACALRLQNRPLGNFFGERLHHYNGFLARCHDQVQDAVLYFVVAGIGDELTFHQTHAYGGDGLRKRYVGEIKGGTTCDRLEHALPLGGEVLGYE